MKEIICFHRWSEWERIWTRTPEGEFAQRHRLCSRCQTTQYNEDAEPRVVIGIIE